MQRVDSTDSSPEAMKSRTSQSKDVMTRESRDAWIVKFAGEPDTDNFRTVQFAGEPGTDNFQTVESRIQMISG